MLPNGMAGADFHQEHRVFLNIMITSKNALLFY
jgi:hypothetical protein